MKNIEVLEQHKKLTHYSSQIKDLQGAKFSYCIIKNTNLIQKECDNIVQVADPSDSYKEYDKERVALCEKHAKKDELGNVIKKNLKSNGSFDYEIDQQDSEWIKDLAELQEKHKDAIESHKEKMKEYEEVFLQEESTLTFHKIDISDVPQQISVEIMAVIEPFLKEN